jgi:uracil-DNA glycosylase
MNSRRPNDPAGPRPSVSTAGRQPSELDALLTEIRACRLCEAKLPLPPRPVVRASATATLLIAGQAPGTLVHGSGIPFNDASGVRLREWLRIDKSDFYDETKVAIVPMGFCYPGRGASGDLPPRPECAATWHPRLLPLLPEIKLTLAIGGYAQAYLLAETRKKTLTDTVQAWQEYASRNIFPLPHPSPRNTAWFKANPWFDAEVVPALRLRINELFPS